MFGRHPELHWAAGSSLGRPFQRDRGNDKGRPWKIPRRQRLILFGGKDGSVFARLYPQTRDLTGDHGVSRGDVVRAGAGSGEDSSWACRAPISGGPARGRGGTAVFAGDGNRNAQRDG